MEIFVVTAIILIAFIGLLVTIAANIGKQQEQEQEQKPEQHEGMPIQSRVDDSDFEQDLFDWANPAIKTSWDHGEIAWCFNVAGINKHGCTFDHVGTFEGYLEPEPENQYDPHAIRVMHCDGTHLGYIKALETYNVRTLFGGSLTYKWPVVGYIKHIIRPGSVWDDQKDVKQQIKENGYFVCRIYIDNQTLCDF